jgi:uncharacterized protein (TIGR02466 family)
MKHLKLFPTNFGVYEVEDFESINKDILELDGAQDGRYFFREYNDIWNLKGEVPGLQKLHDEFLKNAAIYANNYYNMEYKPEYFETIEGWIVSKESSDLRIHNHRLTQIAGVYYPQVTDKTGDIEFFDPRGTLGFVSLDSAKPYNVYRHRPEVGQMILFPGWLLHRVRPNESDIVRVSLATNIRLKDEQRHHSQRDIPPNVPSFQ